MLFRSGYAQHTFSVAPGDTIDVAVGGAGGGGQQGFNTAGGSAGGSYLYGVDWNSLQLLSQPDTVTYQNGAYCQFLNTYGVWNTNFYSSLFDRTVTVNFPASGYYTFNGSCDNYGDIYVDGSIVLSIGGFTGVYTNTAYITAGDHVVKIGRAHV